MRAGGVTRAARGASGGGRSALTFMMRASEWERSQTVTRRKREVCRGERKSGADER
jgi:hypothetical protein